MHEHEYVSEEMLCVLAQVVGEDNVLMTEPMREHTTFKIGGPADVFVTPDTTAPICWWATAASAASSYCCATTLRASKWMHRIGA